MAARDHPAAQVSETTGDTLKIQIVSDLHIEFYGDGPGCVPEDIIIPRAPVLALLGDIGLAFTASLRKFLHLQASRFELVLFIAGNHEFYNHGGNHFSVAEQMGWMRTVCAQRPNLHFLEKDCLDVCGVQILGTTLWSEIPDDLLTTAEESLNDYGLCYNHSHTERPRKLSARETRTWHRESVEWLDGELTRAREEKKPTLVLTHHTPQIGGTSHPRYEGSALNCCFSSDLTAKLREPVIAWACGHTHHCFDMTVKGGEEVYEEGGVRLVSNQRGYAFQVNEDYDPEGVVLEISSA